MAANPPNVIVFAASDPTSGAGLQADLLTLATLGCHPLTVVTALTVQDLRGVHAVHPVDASLMERQARALLAEFRPAAFKIGVLATTANVAAVAQILARHPEVPVVLDPVLASGRGDALAPGDAIAALVTHLLPRTSVLTPNSLEARQLAGAAPDAELGECADTLLRRGARAVLVTGTHEAGSEVTNTLYDASGVVRADRWPRLPGTYHGSGCTLASALAAGLARGRALSHAARDAQAYTWRSLSAAFRPGAGQWIPDRVAAARDGAP